VAKAVAEQNAANLKARANADAAAIVDLKERLEQATGSSNAARLAADRRIAALEEQVRVT